MYPKIDSFIKFLSLTSITGKRDGSTNSEVIFPDGLLSTGDIHDELYEDKAIKRVGRVDLGMENWSYDSRYNFFISGTIYDCSTPVQNGIPTICSMYINKFTNNGLTLANTSINTDKCIRVINLLYNNVTLFKQAMQGVYLYYELENPITYTLDNPLDLSYKVDDFGTESILGANVSTINTTKFNGSIKYALNAADTIRNLQTNYVSTYENQGLDEERKANARKNIGVNGIIDKADKEGIYPDLVAGNLVDEKNTGSSQVIMGLRTSCETDSIVDDGYAQIKRIKGNSIVWNQQIYKNMISSSHTYGGITWTNNNDGSVTLNGTCTVKWWSHAKVQLYPIYTHKYYISNVLNRPSNISTGDCYVRISGVYDICTEKAAIYTYSYSSSWNGSLFIPVNVNTVVNNLKWIPQAFDLTQMFGAGNEPSTVEEFDTLFPLSYKELKNKGDT